MPRRSAATAALVTLALGLPARPQGEGPITLFAGPADQEVQIEADQLVYGWETEVLRLEGHVVARRGEGVVRAAAGTLDRAHGVLTLKGGVLGVQGKDVFLADAAVVDLNARTASLEKAVLYLKERPANPDRPTLGKNALILRGAKVRQAANGAYVAEDVTITPCDCAGEPDYELLADRATIEGDRARLSGTWLRLFRLPLPMFPLSLPLTQRQSGLLAPIFAYGGSPGFAYSQPVFLTLGRSYDVTLTPGFYTGGSSSQSPQVGRRTVRGPALGVEMRYAPFEGTAGLIAFDLFDDLDQRDSPRTDAPPGEQGNGAGRGFGGVRGLARFQHRSEGELGVLAAKGAIASDVMAIADFLPPALGNTQHSLQTDVGAWRVRGPITMGLDATLLQDLRQVNGATPDRRLFGREASSAFQRLPAVFAQIAPTPVGPALFSAEASAAQFLAFAQPRATERATGFALNSPGIGPDLASGDVARAPALRFDLSPRLALNGPARMPLDLRLELGGRADAWIIEGHPDRRRARVYGLAGAYAGLPLERAFDGGWLHRIEPSFEVRALTRSLQSGGPPIGDLADAGGAAYAAAPDAAEQGLAPGLARREGITRPCSAGQDPRGTTCGVPGLRRAYDEIDFAAPSTGAVETVFSLSQSLWARGRGRILRFDLTQDALLWAHGARARVGEASAVAGLQAGSFGVDGGIRWDWSQHAISVVGGTARLHDSRGDEVHASAGLLAGSSSERLRAGIDELFSAARLATAPGELQGTAAVGGSALLPFNLGIKYELSRPLSATLSPYVADWIHTAVLSYDTPCRCAGLLLTSQLAVKDGHAMNGYPSFSLTIDLKSLGSFATF